MVEITGQIQTLLNLTGVLENNTPSVIGVINNFYNESGEINSLLDNILGV